MTSLHVMKKAVLAKESSSAYCALDGEQIIQMFRDMSVLCKQNSLYVGQKWEC